MFFSDKNRNDTVLAVLKKRFEIKDDLAVELADVVEEVDTEIRFNGEYMMQHHTEKLIKTILREKFPNIDVTSNNESFVICNWR